MMFGENGPPCNKGFQMPGHKFNGHAKFTYYA